MTYLKYRAYERDESNPMEIPAFLDAREFVHADVLGIGELWSLMVLDTSEIPSYDMRGPRVWAPMGDARVAKAKESAPTFNLYCSNKTWPVQVVSSGKKPANLTMHPNWEAFEKYHDFDDYPVLKVFDGGELTYVSVKNVAVKNEIMNNAMSGGVPLNTRPELMEQNGVKRPKTGSITAAAWAAFDHMHANKTDFKEVFEKLKEGGMNPSTIRTQFAHWRKFNDISK